MPLATEVIINTIALLLCGSRHFAAVRDASGVVVPVLEGDRMRESRLNEVALSDGEAWAGTYAVAAALAGLGPAPYVFRASDLKQFDAPVVSSASVAISSEGALALIARKAVLDARRIGGRFDRMVIALDSPAPSDVWQRLAAFLSSTLDLPVEVQGSELAFQQFLAHESPAASAALAVLEDQACFSSVAHGSGHSIRVPEHTGLAALHHELVASSTPGMPLTRWSELQVWREFVKWYKAEKDESEPHIYAFLPYLIDRKLPRRAIAFAQARSALQPIFSTAIAAMFAGLTKAGQVQDLYLLGDDALKLGLLEHLRPPGVKLPFQTHQCSLSQVTVSLAEHGTGTVAVARALTDVGICVGKAGSTTFEPAIRAGAALPATGKIRVTAGKESQRRFKLSIASSCDGGPAAVLRTMVFETKPANAPSAGLYVHFDVNSAGALRLRACDEASGTSLDISSSKMPARDGSALDGPEILATLPVVVID